MQEIHTLKHGSKAKRDRIGEIVLPDYTRGEELFNTLTHALGIVIGIVILILAASAAAGSGSAWDMAGGNIYSVSMIALYTISTVYHGLPRGRAKQAMRIVDHCTIYLLIAGTYTPILLTAIRPEHPVLAWTVFACEWGLAAAAAFMTAYDLRRSAKLSMACYIVMGWLIVLVLRPAIEALTLRGFMWLLAGGVSYTVGAVLYGVGKKKRYIHGVFHIFVDIASVLQAVCVLRYAL